MSVFALVPKHGPLVESCLRASQELLRRHVLGYVHLARVYRHPPLAERKLASWAFHVSIYLHFELYVGRRPRSICCAI